MTVGLVQKKTRKLQSCTIGFVIGVAVKSGNLHPKGWFGTTKVIDSYVTLTLDDDPPKKSQVIAKTNTPQWEEPFTM